MSTISGTIMDGTNGLTAQLLAILAAGLALAVVLFGLDYAWNLLVRIIRHDGAMYYNESTGEWEKDD